MRARLERVAAACRGECRWHEPMAGYTTLKVGGPADLVLFPADLEDLERVLSLVDAEALPVLVIGGGSNLLVRDRGIRGCVISLRNLRSVKGSAESRVEAQAGATTGEVSRFAADRGMTGAEFLCGIPGSFGGAVAVNAGAHGSDILGCLESLTTVTGGQVRTRLQNELEYGYRYLRLEPGEVVASAVLKLAQGDPAEIRECMAGYAAHRGAAQKVGFPNAGSFFKNPPGHAAWRLIDEAGLRGETIGGAQVSEVHTNFLVNRGGATAADFLALAQRIKERVRETAGVELEEEVRIVGE